MQIDWLAGCGVGLCLAFIYFLYQRTKQHLNPSLLFSDVSDLATKNQGRAIFAKIPFYLLLGALVFFLAAFLDIHQWISMPAKEYAPTSPLPPKEGIALYLVTDRSGSMQEKVTVSNAEGWPVTDTKMNLLKKVTSDFVKDRPNDLIGLIAFARAAEVLAPLTLDHQVILNALQKLKVIQDPQQDGTSIGYALFKAVNLIVATRHFSQELEQKKEPYYTIKNSVVILVTDGMQDPSRLDYGNPLRTMEPEDAATFAKEKDVRIYIVNIEPSFATEKYLPERHVMERTAEKTGGKFYLLDSAHSLEGIFNEINQIEKSRIQQTLPPSMVKRISYYPYFIGLGLLLLFLAVLLESTGLRQVP